MSGKQRIFFTPLGSETLAIEGSQLWYGDNKGLGSTSDMSRFFVAGSMQFGSDQAVELDKVKAHGRAIGLSDTDRDDVIETWTAWSRRHGRDIEYDRVRTELTNRAIDLPWQPPSDQITEMATKMAAASDLGFWAAISAIKQVLRP